MIRRSKAVFLSLIYFVLGLFIGHQNYSYTSPFILIKSLKILAENSLYISSNVHSINLSEPINGNFTCMKTKTLLNYFTPHICLHAQQTDVYVSKSFNNNSIWEEVGVTHILHLLLRHPHLDFIDIGANIGTYTMYAAALGRFVLAIDCFGPNINRIHRAVQLSNVATRVVLIQNALFNRSGQSLRLSDEVTNMGGQELDFSTNRTYNRSIINNPFIVKTITFDELAPILLARDIRGAIMKIDIEGSESFVVESGSRVFDTVDIPFIQMEWARVRHYPERVKVIFDFFAKRDYDPRTVSCQLLQPAQHMGWLNDVYWIKRNVSSFC
jgi:FkbM family methyltransferase